MKRYGSPGRTYLINLPPLSLYLYLSIFLSLFSFLVYVFEKSSLEITKLSIWKRHIYISTSYSISLLHVYTKCIKDFDDKTQMMTKCYILIDWLNRQDFSHITNASILILHDILCLLNVYVCRRFSMIWIIKLSVILK